MRILHTALFLTLGIGAVAQTITQSGFSFSPDLLTVPVGTQITFVIGSPHNATQVSEATWNSSGTTPLPGGFLFNAGTHQFTPTVPGTYYYLCTVHSFSMKGRIVAETNTGVAEDTPTNEVLVFPNPANTELVVDSDLPAAEVAVLLDLSGKEAMRHSLFNGNRIPVAAIPQGAYVLRVLDGLGTSLSEQQVVIMR